MVSSSAGSTSAGKLTVCSSSSSVRSGQRCGQRRGLLPCSLSCSPAAPRPFNTSRHPDLCDRRVGSAPWPTGSTASRRHDPAGGACRAANVAPSCSTPPSRCSSRQRLPLGGDGRHRRAGRRLQAGALPALPRQARPLPRAARRLVRQHHRQLPPALESTQDNKLRVAATMDAFFAYVANDTGAFRLVFESDLTNEPAVREHVERVTTECADLIAHVISDDTGLPDAGLAAAGGVAGGNGSGQRQVLADRGRRARAVAGGRPGLRPGMARHPRLPAHRRPLNTPARAHQLKENRPWRSRSACSTPPESSSSTPTRRPTTIEKRVSEALGRRRRTRAHRHQGPPDHHPRRQGGLRRDRRRRRRHGRLPQLASRDGRSRRSLRR